MPLAMPKVSALSLITAALYKLFGDEMDQKIWKQIDK